ncbi:beta-lactamase-like protein [Infundibulicybe gibba]|nr:beta-lactamase-like protein [Infundibulicybe gibba]
MVTTFPSSNGSSAVELIFLGTGTSSSIPHIECLTAGPDETPCKTCISTLKPEGRKNNRRNTSIAVRMGTKDGRKVTIVIDAGKNFQAAAMEWFPKYGLRRIDALVITHAHADAMNGLDDLRGWTLQGAIQPHIDVYVSQATFTEVQRSFPYLVAKEFASGGGDVPEFKWHIITDKVPFEITDTGIEITPFSVHHGRIFSAAPPPGYAQTPTATMPSTPTSAGIPLPGRSNTFENGIKQPQELEGVIHPYLCFGFKIANELVYLSDVSHIPNDAWPIISFKNSQGSGKLPVLVLDCLGLEQHTSHFGIRQAVENARQIGATRTYLTGFGHRVTHDEYVTLGEIVGGSVKGPETLSESEQAGVKKIAAGPPVWIRPAHDGLRVFIDESGRTRDETYGGSLDFPCHDILIVFYIILYMSDNR